MHKHKEDLLDAWEAKMLGLWVPREGEKIPEPMTKEQWDDHMRKGSE